jgi:predicted transcriptional regulator
MKVGELCTRVVAIAWEDETVVEAAQRMREKHVGDVIIVHGPEGSCKPVGILTDRDIVVGVVAQAAEHLSSVLVGDVAQSKLVLVREEEDLFVALEHMRGAGVRRLPVVGAEGMLVGILTLDDVLEFLAEELGAMVQLVRREQELERNRRT